MAKKTKKAKESVKEVQQDLRESAHKIWLAGLGALSAAEEEGGKLFKNLVSRGEDLETRGRREVKSTVKDVKSGVKAGVDKAVNTVGTAWEDLGEGLDDRITSVLHRLGVPSRDEIQTLTQRIEDLAGKVDQLAPKKAAPRKRATTRAKTAAKKTTTRPGTAAKKTTTRRKSTAKKAS